MKRLNSTIFIVLAFLQVSLAQYFKISIISDKVPSVIQAGAQKTYNINVEPLNGFSASLYFSASAVCFKGQLTIAKTTLNPSYTGQSITIKPDAQCAGGNYEIVVKAFNGNFSFLDTLYISVTENNAGSPWKLYDQSNSSIRNDNNNRVFFDSSGIVYTFSNPAYPAGVNQKIALGYLDKEWHTRSPDSLYNYDNCGNIKSKLPIKSEFWNQLLNVYNKDLFFFNFNSIIRTNQNLEILNQYNLKQGYSPNGIYIDKKGTSWILMFGELAHISGSQIIYWSPAINSFPASYVFAVEQDDAGNYWLASKEGLLKYDGQFWTTYSTSTSSLSNDEVVSVVVKNGKIFGNTRKSIFIMENNYIRDYPCPFISSEEQHLSAFLLNNETDMFAGLNTSNSTFFGGLVRFKDGNWYLYNNNTSSNFPQCSPSYQHDEYSVIDLGKDKQGNVWTSVSGCGLIKFNPDNIFTKQVITGTISEKPNHSDLVSAIPNPSSDGNFKISASDQITKVDIFDIQSNKVFTTFGSEISGLGKGIYIANIYSKNGIKNLKIVVTK
ncbi:MAG: T9SS type A sorting domain-containing protein [Opitutaceae bacterium]|nr:T9SS type A sorting domain-containing protein [Cytophagales bacterium]